MYETSVYKYFRPFFVLCCLLGQFSSFKVLGQTTDELEFKWFTIPVLVFIIGQIVGIFAFKDLVFEPMKNNTFLLVHHTLTVVLNIIVMAWLTSCSRDVIKSLKEVDKNRRTISNLLPRNCIPKESKLLVQAVVAVILLVFAMVCGLLQVMFNGSHDLIVNGYVYYIFLNFFPLKSFLIIGAVFFSASLSIQDMFESLRHYKRFNCKPDHNIHTYCQLMMLQSEFIRSTNKFMRNYLMTALGYRVFNIMNILFYRAHSTSYMSSSAVDFAAWNSCMMYFLLGVRSGNIQFQKITKEVFSISTCALSKGNAIKMRLLVAQLQARPGDITAAGFVKVTPHLFLSFLGMAVEWMIVFIQNPDAFRELVGMAPQQSLK